MKILIFVLALVSAQVSIARELTAEQKLQDFSQLVNIIKANYGPLEYKAATQQIDAAKLANKYEAMVRATTSNRDFYYNLTRYVAEFKDGHFGIYVPSTHVLSVPITTDLIDGKVLITKIDRTKIDITKFKFDVGDEIVTVEGKPVADYISETAKLIPNGNPRATDRAASWSIFFRRAARLPVPTKKTISFEVRRGTSSIVESAELDWVVSGRALNESGSGVSHGFLSGRFHKPIPSSFDLLTNDSVRDYLSPLADREFQCSGDTRIEIPKDATVIMKTPVVAYYHSTAKGNVGYLRIPHYYPQDKNGEVTFEIMLEWLAKYEFAIRELEKNTVGLVIDQDHNCGGSIWMVHQVISLFMDRPFAQSQFELLANKEAFLKFQKWNNAVAENTLEKEGMSRVLKLIEDTWLKGTSFLTEKTSIDGRDMVQPNLIRYTKPIVILIDEMAGSGGDMFPAMMQGLGRAKLFGQQTAGLGGHVEEFPAGLPNSQMTFRMTKSLFYRPNGVAIENNGAMPDKLHTITRDDVLYGFKTYQRSYLDYLLNQIP